MMMAKQEERRLPEGWRWVKLGDICKTTSGGTPHRGNSNFYGGSIPWVKSGELNDTIIVETEEAITSEALRSSSAKIFNKGTLLVAMYGATVGKLGILGINAATNQAVCAIFTSEIIDRDYLFFHLLCERQNLLKMSFGGAQPNISQAVIRNLEIPLPPIAEQKRLVAILNDRFAAIETARKATEAQLEAAKALPAAYLREVFNSPEAEGWRSVKLGDVADFKNGINFTGDQKGRGILTVDVLNMYSDNLFIRTDELYRIDIEPKEDYLLQQNDILFVRSSVKREGVGWTSLCPFMPEPMSFCGFIIRVRIIVEELLPEFVTHYCRSPFVREQLISKSGTGTITNISQLQLKTLSVPLPPIAKQKEIVTTLNDRFATIETIRKAIEDQLEAINALPATLLRQAFNGEL
jgi:type I restriction enzyme S subunit